MLTKGRNIERGSLWTNHPCSPSNTSYKKLNVGVNQIITQWLVPSPVNKRKRSKELNFLKEEIYWQGKLSKRRKIGNFLSRWLRQGRNRLSFLIVVKGGEWLDVSINAKGGECWKEFSLMSKEFSNDKGITKDMMTCHVGWSWHR